MKHWYLFAIGLMLAACQPQDPAPTVGPQGDLFIIGGGKRPPELVQDLIAIAGVDTAGYIAVLPMSSGIPDTSYYYARKQFVEQGIERVHNFYLAKGERYTPAQLDSITKAQLIYLTGGNQNTFMDIVQGTGLVAAVQKAYQQGATIAGTSAGAALQSEVMLTGDEKKYPEYDGEFPTIEANNLIVAPGLGLLKTAIIDQHFVQRSRMNRLIAVILEHPHLLGIGIDESTAIHVHGDSARVHGVSQVLTLQADSTQIRTQGDLIAGRNMRLSIYLPGESFKLPAGP